LQDFDQKFASAERNKKWRNEFQTNDGQKVAVTGCWKKLQRHRHSQ